MDWMKEILKKYVSTDKLEEAEKEMNKAFPLNAVPKDQYTKKTDEIRTLTGELDQTKVKLDETSQQFKALSESTGDIEELKKTAADATKALDDYKAGEESRTAKLQTDMSKKRILERQLLGDDVKLNKDALDLVVGRFKLDEMALADDGESFATGFQPQLDSLKESKPSLFAKTETKDPSGPPSETQTPPAELDDYAQAEAVMLGK